MSVQYDYNDDSTQDVCDDVSVFGVSPSVLNYFNQQGYSGVVAGVYLITNLPEDKIYIGSSGDIDVRWGQHVKELNEKTHHNYRLQADWNRLGCSNFSFSIIWVAEKEVDRNEIFAIEQMYIDQHTPEYNILKDVRFAKSNYNPIDRAAEKADFNKNRKAAWLAQKAIERQTASREYNYHKICRRLHTVKVKVKTTDNPVVDRIHIGHNYLHFNYETFTLIYPNGEQKQIPDFKFQKTPFSNLVNPSQK